MVETPTPPIFLAVTTDQHARLKALHKPQGLMAESLVRLAIEKKGTDQGA